MSSCPRSKRAVYLAFSDSQMLAIAEVAIRVRDAKAAVKWWQEKAGFEV